MAETNEWEREREFSDLVLKFSDCIHELHNYPFSLGTKETLLAVWELVMQEKGLITTSLLGLNPDDIIKAMKG
jgi:hypothetical protein